MKGFADWQDAFQRAILHGDDAVLATLTEGAREDRATLLGVYRHAYGARLVEAMAKEHEVLHGFLGDEQFAEVARAYVAAHPSGTRASAGSRATCRPSCARPSPFATIPWSPSWRSSRRR